MKIRLKGLAKLLKAIPNRAHLFPVKVLVNGKNKSFYAIRYKTGNKAMEIVLKQMRIPKDREALFDSKDGKAKNLSEKDILEIYSKAGKPGSLNEFIQANFKKPIIKPRNSSTVDLDSKQMSIDDLMDQQNGGDGNSTDTEESSSKGKTEKLWQEFEKWRVKADNDLFGIINSYHKKVEDMTPSEYRRIMTNFFESEIANGYMQLGETVDECIESYIQLFKDQVKDKEDRETAWSDDYYKEIYSHLEEMFKKGGMFVDLDAKKYIRQFVMGKKGVDRYAAQNAGEAALKEILEKNGKGKEKKKKEPKSNISITGPIYDDDERPTYYINDNGYVIETQDVNLVNEYRAKQKQQEEAQYQEPQEENTDESQDTKPTTDEQEANEKITKYKNYLESKESDIDIDKVSGNLVRETTAIDYSNAKKNILRFIDKNSQVSNKSDLERIVGAGVRNLDNVKKIIETVDDDGFWNGYRDFKTQRPNLLEKQGVNSLIVYYNEYNKNKQQETTQGQEPQETKMAFRNVGLNGGLVHLILMREGTTRVTSKNEYKEVKNIEGLIKQIEPLKDSHTKIKGRAIMDMLGISADLYSREGNIPFPTGSIGYISRSYNIETGECRVKEIGLVADRDNPAAETKTAIHECMHGRIGLAGKSDLLDLRFGNDKEGIKLAKTVEESLVEMAGQAIAHKVHGNEANQLIHSYPEAIVSVLPNIWGSDIFKKSRKNGLLGIGMEIAKRINSKDTNFLNEMLSKNQNVDKELHSKRINAIESKIKDRSDKVDKIQNDTGISEIANLVEELKRGTISLEGALNSSKYRELAAVLITKFLEDEDIDALEQLALSF